MELDIVKILRICNDACETELEATLNNPMEKVKFDSHRFRYTTCWSIL